MNKKIFGLMRNSVMGVAAAVLSGCANLPSEGPLSSQIEKSYKNTNTAGFELIPINDDVSRYLAQHSETSFGDRFGKGSPVKSDRIGPGDVLNVQIWEADPDGIFAITTNSNKGAVQDVQVDASGRITIPYAGSIKAAGKTPTQLGKTIANALQEKAVEPQVQVSRKSSVSSVITVSGGVSKPGIYPLTVRGDTLLDIVATSGGSAFPAHETIVNLTRNGALGSAYLDHFLRTPSDNIYVRPGDQISIERKPRTFSAFGAVDKKGNIEFGASELNLLEAVSKASGLANARADAAGVFLFRFESAKAVESLQPGFDAKGRDTIPVIYRLNLKDASQYFFAQVIAVRDRDVIYVADSSAVELQKFLGILGSSIGVGAGSIGAAVTVGNL